MPHALDIGFHWTDLTVDGSPPGSRTDAGTLSYGFVRENGTPAGQKDFQALLNDTLSIGVYELSRTPNLRVPEVRVDVEKVGDPTQREHLRLLDGRQVPQPPDGKPDAASTGLNALGTAWFTDPAPLDEEGMFLITVRIVAELGNDRRHWAVDPKIIVGRG